MSTLEQLADEQAESEGELAITVTNTISDVTPNLLELSMSIEEARQIVANGLAYADETYRMALDRVKAEGMGDG